MPRAAAPPTSASRLSPTWRTSARRDAELARGAPRRSRGAAFASRPPRRSSTASRESRSAGLVEHDEGRLGVGEVRAQAEGHAPRSVRSSSGWCVQLAHLAAQPSHVLVAQALDERVVRDAERARQRAEALARRDLAPLPVLAPAHVLVDAAERFARRPRRRSASPRRAARGAPARSARPDRPSMRTGGSASSVRSTSVSKRSKLTARIATAEHPPG